MPGIHLTPVSAGRTLQVLETTVHQPLVCVDLPAVTLNVLAAVARRARR